MTLKDLYKIASERGAKITLRTDSNYRIQYPKGYKGNKKESGVTYVSGLKCYVCDEECLQAWTSWKSERKPTCKRKCADRGMFHDMQHHHNGKWWDKYHIDGDGYKLRRRKDPESGKIIRSYRHQDNFESYYGRSAKSGYHLHHINMHKRSDDVSNLIEVTPTRHQELHTTYNTLCKSLMDDGIVGFDLNNGYYRKDKK